jgi:hypothetical protein
VELSALEGEGIELDEARMLPAAQAGPATLTRHEGEAEEGAPAAVAEHLGAADHAERLVAVLRPYAGQAVPLMVVPTQSVTHHLGLLFTTLGHYDEAEAWFAAAAATHERLGAPHWLASTRLERARMLLARRAAGDAERARDLLGHALATARELGLVSLERRTVALLTCP